MILERTSQFAQTEVGEIEMSTSTALMTADELLRLPRGQYRHELINGELKTMPLAGHKHGRITVRLSSPMAQFVWDKGLGEVFTAETGFKLTSNPDTVLAPDVCFVAKDQVERAGNSDGYFEGPPALAVEVLSPSERSGQVSKKVSQWLFFGAKQVWVVNPKTRTVVVHELDKDSVTLSEGEVIDGGNLLPGFQIPVSRLFEL